MNHAEYRKPQETARRPSSYVRTDLHKKILQIEIQNWERALRLLVMN